LFDYEKALASADLAPPAALSAGACAGPSLGSATAAWLAGGAGIDLKLNRLARIGVVEADFEIVPQIGPATHISALTALAIIHEFAENILEKIGKRPEILRTRTIARPTILESGMAEAIISGALLRILQAIISLADRLEARFRFMTAGVAIRMAFHRQPPVGRLDSLLIRAPLHLK
jgi:hypothetical protein